MMLRCPSLIAYWSVNVWSVSGPGPVGANGNCDSRSGSMVRDCDIADRFVGDGLLDFRDHGVRTSLVRRSLDDRDEVLELNRDAVGAAAAHKPYAVSDLLRGDAH